MRYRKLPIEIEAVQIGRIDGDRALFHVGDTSPEWLMEALEKDIGATGGIWTINDGLRIGTLEGTMRAEAGDFIVRGVKGEIYSVKSDVFLATYEPVEAP